MINFKFFLYIHKMEAIKDLIFGDPVYDRRGRVVRRNFGIKNALVIILIVYGLYSLRGKMGIKSGRRKLRGGGSEVGSQVGSQVGSKVGSDPSNAPKSDLWSMHPWWMWLCIILGALGIFSVVMVVVGAILIVILSFFTKITNG